MHFLASLLPVLPLYQLKASQEASGAIRVTSHQVLVDLRPVCVRDN